MHNVREVPAEMMNIFSDESERYQKFDPKYVNLFENCSKVFMPNFLFIKMYNCGKLNLVHGITLIRVCFNLCSLR